MQGTSAVLLTQHSSRPPEPIGPPACPPAPAQCTFRQLQPSGMMARLEGVNAALPLRLPPDVCLSRGEQHRPQLEEELKQATERFLCSMGVVKPGTKPARLTTFNSTQRPGTHGGQVTADDGGACSAASRRSLDEDGGSGRRLSLDEDRCKVASLFKPLPKAFNICAQCSWEAGTAAWQGAGQGWGLLRQVDAVNPPRRWPIPWFSLTRGGYRGRGTSFACSPCPFHKGWQHAPPPVQAPLLRPPRCAPRCSPPGTQPIHHTVAPALRAVADEEDEPAQQRTVLIMQHKVKLRFVPPGIGKLLLGERLCQA